MLSSCLHSNETHRQGTNSEAALLCCTLTVFFLSRPNHVIMFPILQDSRGPRDSQKNFRTYSALHQSKNERTNARTHTHTAPRAVGCSWVFSAMLKSLTSVVLRLKENTGHLLPPPNPCWCRDTNLQPLDSKSNSRTIRPRLPNVSPSQNSCNCPITCCARSEETDLPFFLIPLLD